MRDAVIVSAVRTAVGKAPKGTLRATRPDDLGAAAIRGALERVPNLDIKEIEDVIIGCAMPEAEQGMNVARIASLRAGLPIEAAAMTVNRYCASGLQSIALAAERIRGGGADVIVAGGAESMSLIPMGGNKISINPWLEENYPGFVPLDGPDGRARGARTTASRARRPTSSRWPAIRRRWRRRRPGSSSRRSCRCRCAFTAPDAKSKLTKTRSNSRWTKARAPTPRSEALAKLKPAFHASGQVTAGNSSQTSDGAAAAVVMSEERAAGPGNQAARALRRVRLRGLPAGRDGRGTGVRHPEGAEAGRA